MGLCRKSEEFIAALNRLAFAGRERADAERYLGESIRLLAKALHPPKAHSAKLRYSGGNMPATIDVGKTAHPVFQEFTGDNGSGDPIAPIGPVTYAGSDPTIATVDPSSGVATGVAAGSITVTATDGGNGLSAQDTLTVNAVVPPPPVAKSATLSMVAD